MKPRGMSCEEEDTCMSYEEEDTYLPLLASYALRITNEKTVVCKRTCVVEVTQG